MELRLRMEDGEMEDGEWRMENGEWRMENGEWRIIIYYLLLTLGNVKQKLEASNRSFFTSSVISPF